MARLALQCAIPTYLARLRDGSRRGRQGPEGLPRLASAPARRRIPHSRPFSPEIRRFDTPVAPGATQASAFYLVASNREARGFASAARETRISVENGREPANRLRRPRTRGRPHRRSPGRLARRIPGSGGTAARCADPPLHSCVEGAPEGIRATNPFLRRGGRFQAHAPRAIASRMRPHHARLKPARPRIPPRAHPGRTRAVRRRPTFPCAARRRCRR